VPAETGKVAMSPQALRVSSTMLDDTPNKTAIKRGLDKLMCIASSQNADSILDLQFLNVDVFMARLCCPCDSERTGFRCPAKFAWQASCQTQQEEKHHD
jgi:hypothetical protein